MIEIHDMTRRKRAKGKLDPQGRVIIACRFEDELFDEISMYAAAKNISVAAMIRMLVRKGLNGPVVVERAA